MDSDFYWIHEPKQYTYKDGVLEVITDPGTDYWQRTYYGFQNDNAPSFVKDVKGDYTFTMKTTFHPKVLYDQSGIVLYQGSDDWLKISAEFHTKDIYQLGSVVTNLGYSDWAFLNSPANFDTIYYRLSKRGQDFLIEYSKDGQDFQWMRVLHMHKPIEVSRIGVYCCSPQDSSFKATFSEMTFTECQWKKE